MAKEKNQWKAPLMGVFALLTAFIIGGLFINGSTTGNVVLGYVPGAVHPIVGWIIVIAAAVFGVMGAYKLVRKKM